MNVNIRPAGVEDASEMADLLKESVTLLSEDYSDEQIKAIADYFNTDFYREEIRDNQRVIYLAEAENKLVGYGSISANGMAISDIFVLPEYTRQGIGTLLLLKLEQIAIDKGTAKLWVMASLTARSFYASRGFEYDKDSALIDAETEVRIPCVDMTKVLSHNLDFKGKNLGDYGDLSTLTVPQFIRLGIKILLGSST